MTMESSLGHGTCTTFWIPFKKPQMSGASGLTQPLPDRLQSEMSVSCNSSEHEPSLCGPSADLLDRGRSTWRHPSLSLSATSSQETDLAMSERANILVLVVEDNPINQQIATKTIKKLGFQVTAVWNGKEALNYVTAAQNRTERKPDVILMDVQMPVIDGYKCTHILRRHKPYRLYVNEIPIVAMTASAIQGDREKSLAAGYDDYLSKPVRRKTLETMLIRWCTKSRPTRCLAEGLEPSDCSESGDRCDKAYIPGIVDDEATSSSPDGVPSMWPDNFSDDQVTPRAQSNSKAGESTDHFPGYSTESTSAGSPTLEFPTVQPKLFSIDGPVSGNEAISAAVGESSQLTSSVLPLTEENVGRLDHESH